MYGLELSSRSVILNYITNRHAIPQKSCPSCKRIWNEGAAHNSTMRAHATFDASRYDASAWMALSRTKVASVSASSHAHTSNGRSVQRQLRLPTLNAHSRLRRLPCPSSRAGISRPTVSPCRQQRGRCHLQFGIVRSGMMRMRERRRCLQSFASHGLSRFGSLSLGRCGPAATTF